MEDDKITELLDRRKKKSPKEDKGASKHYGLCPPGAEQMVTFRLRDGRQHLSLNYGHMLQCYWSKSGEQTTPAEIISPIAKAVRSVNPFSSPKSASNPQKATEHIKVTFTAGWEIRMTGRGLETIHRALVSRSLSWIKSAAPGEADKQDIETFVNEISLVRSNISEQTQSPPQ